MCTCDIAEKLRLDWCKPLLELKKAYFRPKWQSVRWTQKASPSFSPFTLVSKYLKEKMIPKECWNLCSINTKICTGKKMQCHYKVTGRVTGLQQSIPVVHLWKTTYEVLARIIQLALKLANKLKCFRESTATQSRVIQRAAHPIVI